ncbi:ABC transporter permease [Pelistega sp. NLN82]|uniref:ABC transporter permease n=1 Tax=Pelistega ratti TaxID=2652177 RepID=A0A6L9Y4P2_9BURK|nr:ABC transporter permease [Pelistega ratti]NEN75430.1 ABC transporter permease [Pelistega ratti]
MFRWVKNVVYLSAKELRSLLSDPVLIVLIVYMFSLALYTVATSITTEVKNASIAVVDHDHSALSYRLQQSLLLPNFKKVDRIKAEEIDRLMDIGEYTFVLDIPPGYEKDVLAGHHPQIQLLVDATAMTQAAIGSSYISQIFRREITEFLHQSQLPLPITATVNVLYNPNYSSEWFLGGMNIIGNLNLLTMLLVGAAVIRERERGTLEHILVMPVRSSEIAMSKIFANGLVLLLVVTLALRFVTHSILGVPLPDGSVSLFVLGSAVFIFSIASLGILLAIFAPTMPQFGLLMLPVYIVLYLLSGTVSSVDNMPELAQKLTQFSPTTIFAAYAQDVLFRGAGLDIVWDKLAKMAALGTVFLIIALMQFKSMLSKQG